MDNSERPTKKIRLSTSTAYDNIPDIGKVRQQNDLKLQGRFQAIFDKYDRDFTGVSDEIDLVTGEIVEDNGHLSGMRHEHDIGRKTVRKALAASTQRRLQHEHDELAPPMISAKPTTSDIHTLDPAILASGVAMAFTNNQNPFDPFDPTAVAELGKSIALHIAQIMQKPGTTQAMSNHASESRACARQTMTPPVSEPDFASPIPHRQNLLFSEGPNHTRSSHSDCFDSIWAGRDRAESPIPEEETLPKIFGQSCNEVPAIERGAREDTTELKVPKKRGYFTKTRWSQEDDDRLLRLKADEQLTWVQIASCFQDRTSKGVEQHHAILQKKRTGNSTEFGRASVSSVSIQKHSDAPLESDKSQKKDIEAQKKRTASLTTPVERIAPARAASSIKKPITRADPTSVNGKSISKSSTKLTAVTRQAFSHVLVPSTKTQPPTPPPTQTEEPFDRVASLTQAVDPPKVVPKRSKTTRKRKSRRPPKIVSESSIAVEVGSDDELG